MMTSRPLGLPARRGPLILIAAITAGLLLLPAVAGARNGDTRPDSEPAKPTIVLVHGAWADASGWSSVIRTLEAKGFTVDAPPNPLRGLARDSAYIANYLSTIAGPIVLVGQSYGGAVITNVATGNPNVKALVYIDAFVPAQGDTLAKLAMAKPGSCVGGDPNDVFDFATDPGQPDGDPDLYLKVSAGPGYAGFDACFANFVHRNDAAVGRRTAAARRGVVHRGHGRAGMVDDSVLGPDRHA